MSQQLVEERNFLLILRAQIDARLNLLDQSIGGITRTTVSSEATPLRPDTTTTRTVNTSTWPTTLSQSSIHHIPLPANSQQKQSRSGDYLPPSAKPLVAPNFAPQSPSTTTTTVTTTTSSTSLDLPIRPGHASHAVSKTSPTPGVKRGTVVGPRKERFGTPPQQSAPRRTASPSSVTSKKALFEERAQSVLPAIQPTEKRQDPRRVSVLVDRINRQVETLPQEKQTTDPEVKSLLAGRLMEKPCVACGEGQGTVVFIPSRCAGFHPPLLCTSCMGNYASTRLLAENSNHLPVCPCNGPDAHLIYKDMRELRACNAISDRTFDFYLNRLREQDVGAVHSNWIWCPCSNCGDLVYGEPGQGKMICRGCKNFLCFTHETPWHIGRTCTQVDEMLNTEKTFVWVNENAKACPQCGKLIEQNGGCIHMKCVCGHEFFWCCLRAYRDVAAAKQHKKECNYLLNVE